MLGLRRTVERLMDVVEYLADWWNGRHARLHDPASVQQAYLATFSSPEGQIVLDDLIARVYATVCYRADELAAHNGRRSLVHEILQNIEFAKMEQPSTE